jgi:hypothetical protein
VELFYGSEHIERQEGVISLDISKMARKLHVRPTRLRDTLDWLEQYGILSSLVYGRNLRSAKIVLREPSWKKRKAFNG